MIKTCKPENEYSIGRDKHLYFWSDGSISIENDGEQVTLTKANLERIISIFQARQKQREEKE